MSDANGVITVKFLKALLNECPDNCQVFLSKDENLNSPVRSFGFGLAETSQDGAAIVKLVGEDAPLFNAVVLFPS